MTGQAAPLPLVPVGVLTSRAALLTAGYYSALFCAFGAFLPYWPLWLADWGLSEGEIGLYLGLGMAVRLVAATVLPALADRFAARRGLLALGGLAAAGLYLAHLFVDSRAALLTLTLVLAVAMGPLVPVAEAMGVRAALAHRFAYAHARAIGSIAFLLTTVAVGALVARDGSGPVLWISVGFLVVSAGFGAIHPGGAVPPGQSLDRARLGDAWTLARNPLFLCFAIASAMTTASHSIYYSFSTLEWGRAGISHGTIGLLWAMGVIAETALMLGPGRPWVARIGPGAALAVAGAAGVLRWGLMLWNPGLPELWLIQCLHALTFSIGHLGAMAFVAAAVPPRLAASAQGICTGGLSGIAFAVSTPLGGWLNAGFGPGSAYALAMAMSLIGLVAAWRLARHWDGGRIQIGEP